MEKMILIIHLEGNKKIEILDDFTQEHINTLYEQLDTVNKVHYLDNGGKNYIIPTNKIIYIETKLKL